MGEHMKKMKKKGLYENMSLKGIVDLYHFSRTDLGDETILDPESSTKNKSSWSKREYMTSSFPRVFYYTDLSNVEQLIKSGSKSLYHTKVDSDKLLNLVDAMEKYKKDRDELKRTDKKAYEVMEAFLKSKFYPDNPNYIGGPDWTKMFQTCAKNYIGLYYMNGNIPMVNILVPLKVRRYANL
jgi:hypothetical protein